MSGVCLITAPIVCVLGSALGMGIYQAKGLTFLTRMAAHHARVGWALNVAPAGVTLLLFAVIAVAQRICLARPGWGRAGGVLAIIGLLGPIFFEAIYWGAWHLTSASYRAAGAYMTDQSQIIPRTIMNVSGPAIVVGFILLGVGAAKAHVLPRWGAVLLGLTCIIPVGFISGHIVISAVGFLGTTVALVPLGVRTLRANSHELVA